ncbi:PREDICTED: L-lactate dehydrogenase A-like [Nelumbo nucifera]|uniref:L-lactate dehydrogenase A-like n=1 Tax=Nelumbo nucifera TaxID=4432 RepID=A0A1U8Q5K8_NELNU|nr:PREDICTED: L-lactate dehydrogenase A-like [Nelumbo nucifera]
MEKSPSFGFLSQDLDLDIAQTVASTRASSSARSSFHCGFKSQTVRVLCINLRSLVDRNKANFIPPTSHMTDHPKPSQTILTQDLADELALVDAKPDKLRDAKPAYFSHRSDLCIVMAGAHQNTGESRPSLLHRNVALFRNIIQPLAQHSQDSILMIVSNSVDILTYVAWKLSRFPYNRVTGSGTNLDSSRFRRV